MFRPTCRPLQHRVHMRAAQRSERGRGGLSCGARPPHPRRSGAEPLHLVANPAATAREREITAMNAVVEIAVSGKQREGARGERPPGIPLLALGFRPFYL